MTEERRLRDLDQLRDGLVRWLSPTRADAVDVELARPSAGWSNETLLVTVRGGAEPERLVVRLPALLPASPDSDPAREAAVLTYLARCGVPVPGVVAVEQDPDYLGSTFLVMTHESGRAVGEVPGRDPWIMDSPELQQRAVQDRFVEALAGLHRAPADAASLGLRTGLAEELAYWQKFVDWAADGSPSAELVELLDWCAGNVPTHTAPDVLLWGDARLGNTFYDERREITALLDWELASIGPREMDVSWYLTMERLTSRAARAVVPGFLADGALVEHYESVTGAPISSLPWHTIFTLARATCINDREARIAHRVGASFPGVFGDGHPMVHKAQVLIDQLS